jgi:ABC-type nitrate/sulfonate/bicarbonate transport system substrate-binding protein
MLQIPHKFFAIDEGFRKLAAGADVYRAVMGGLTTTRATLTERPELVTKTIRATMRGVRLIKSDKKYVLDWMKGPHLDLTKERERYAERVYDATVQLYLTSGTVDETLQHEMIAVASQRAKPAHPVPPERVFDFSFAQKVSESLR